jgi:hypothetical protein
MVRDHQEVEPGLLGGVRVRHELARAMLLARERVPDVHDLRAAARPPFRPAAFFWAVVPPWDRVDRRPPLPDFFPPRLDAPGEFAMRAARSFDIPFSFSRSYCFSFLTLGRLLGIARTSSLKVFPASRGGNAGTVSVP